jgi:hypothetical protein
MSTHRYPIGALAGDYGRAGIGLLLTAGPLLLADPTPPVAYVLAAFACLFLVYGARTVRRQIGAIVITDDGLVSSGLWSEEIRWNDVRKVQLKFFSTRRDRANGWMQLVVAGGGRRLTIDSGIDGFGVLARRAAQEAERRELQLNEDTIGNLNALAADEAGRLMERGI